MQERLSTESNSRQTRPARPRLLLSWRLDRVTGKPVAQWTVEAKTRPVDSTMAAHFEFRAAA
jgi:hypothetical protein